MKWDRGLDYETAHNLILKHMKRASPRSACYDSILLVQLRNGLRISEAVRAYKEFLKAKSREVYVNVSKKKKPETRLAVVPEEVRVCEELLLVEDAKLVNRVKNYVRKAYGFNTHSLRYSFITHLLKAGVNPSIVAKITRHSRLDMVLEYTQEKVAEEVLRKM